MASAETEPIFLDDIKILKNQVWYLDLSSEISAMEQFAKENRNF